MANHANQSSQHSSNPIRMSSSSRGWLHAVCEPRDVREVSSPGSGRHFGTSLYVGCKGVGCGRSRSRVEMVFQLPADERNSRECGRALPAVDSTLRKRSAGNCSPGFFGHVRFSHDKFRPPSIQKSNNSGPPPLRTTVGSVSVADALQAVMVRGDLIGTGTYESKALSRCGGDQRIERGRLA